MQYRRLARTGIEVSSQCLGAMMFGSMGNTDPDDCIAIINRALDGGINFVDTADVYSRGESEQIVGKAIASRRNEIVLATKFFNPMGDDRNARGGSRRWIMRAVEESLRRLGTDYIDLYQAHRMDFRVDLEETLGALTDLVRQGKVRYIGTSSFPAAWLVEAQWTSQRAHLERFICEQPQYSIFARSAERDVLSTCLRHAIGVISWSPLAGGWLTGKYRRDKGFPVGSRYGEGGAFSRRRVSADVNEQRYDLIERLDAVADDAGLPLTSLALAFAGEHPAVTSTIIGPRTSSQLEDALAAADVRLASATIDAIDAIVAPGTDVAGIDHGTGDRSLRVDSRRRPPPTA
jgi:aryl-alcohol dehydrogenase-like predicted oxidoreductase